MVFYLSNKEYLVDVNKTFTLAEKDDYIDDLDVLGVIVHNLSTDTEFGNSTIMIMYNEMEDKITVEIQDAENDSYTIIKEEELNITKDERDLIKEKLRCE